MKVYVVVLYVLYLICTVLSSKVCVVFDSEARAVDLLPCVFAITSEI